MRDRAEALMQEGQPVEVVVADHSGSLRTFAGRVAGVGADRVAVRLHDGSGLRTLKFKRVRRLDAAPYLPREPP
jgi:broad specificity phosphatase PhoE